MANINWWTRRKISAASLVAVALVMTSVFAPLPDALATGIGLIATAMLIFTALIELRFMKAADQPPPPTGQPLQ